MITSTSNLLVKLAISLHQKKGRQETGLFLTEGIHLVQEALQAGSRIERYFFTAKLANSSEGAALLERLVDKAPGEEISEAVLGKICETETPQGILALVKIPAVQNLDLAETKLGLVLDSLQDPGNVGTIIRTAWAAGVDNLICTPGTVDTYQGKVVRSSMGGVFYQTIHRNMAPEQIAEKAQAAGAQLVMADPSGVMNYFEWDFTSPSIIIVGNEGRGFIHDWSKFPVGRVNIPQPGRADSLNVAVSAGVLIYEAVRQCYRKLL